MEHEAIVEKLGIYTLTNKMKDKYGELYQKHQVAKNNILNITMLNKIIT